MPAPTQSRCYAEGSAGCRKQRLRVESSTLSTLTSRLVFDTLTLIRHVDEATYHFQFLR